MGVKISLSNSIWNAVYKFKAKIKFHAEYAVQLLFLEFCFKYMKLEETRLEHSFFDQLALSTTLPPRQPFRVQKRQYL